LIKPGILAGWILVFVTLMRELGSSILLYTPRTVVSSIVLWNLWDEGKFVAMSAFAVLITLISVVFVTLLFKFVRTSISVG
jgi:iron(III) transport system permease protein